jgi:gas vesicle protein
MKTQDDEVNMKIQTDSPLPSFTWLIAGIGIGAVAGILLAPQSGENTRDWVSNKCKSGMDTVNSKVRQTGQQVEDWIDEGQHRVREAVNAGRDAFGKAKSETS